MIAKCPDFCWVDEELSPLEPAEPFLTFERARLTDEISMWYCCPQCGIAAGHGVDPEVSLTPDGMDQPPMDSPTSVQSSDEERCKNVRPYLAVTCALITSWVVILARDVPREEYVTDWSICNGLVTAAALVIPMMTFLGRLTPGLWPISLTRSEKRLNASAMSRLIGSVMGFRRGDLVETLVFATFLLPLSIVVWLQNSLVQLYVVLSLLVVVVSMRFA